MIDRIKHPTLIKSDFEEFISQLKPMEITVLWEVIKEHEHFAENLICEEDILSIVDDIRHALDQLHATEKQLNTIKSEIEVWKEMSSKL